MFDRFQPHPIRQSILAALVIAGGLSLAPRESAAQNNPMFTELLQKGVAFGADFRKLRTPTLPDGLNAADQQKAIDAVLTARNNSNPKLAPLVYADFTKNSLQAKYVLTIDDLNPPFGGANMPGHSIDLWFVVWGNLPAIAKPAFIKGQFQPDPKDHVDVIKPADLPKGILPQPIAGGGDYYAHGQFMIFSNDQRVRVDATVRATQTNSQESTTLAAIIDPRFNQNAKYPNEWCPVKRDANGKILVDAKGQPQLGAPVLYTSAGGYVKITKLVQPAGSMLVEYHFVYDEPNGWFGGNNLLRIKLPIKTEDDVRDFRRKVKAASAMPANAPAPAIPVPAAK